MIDKYKIAIETTNWLMWQTESDFKDIPQEVIEELRSLNTRLNYLFDTLSNVTED